MTQHCAIAKEQWRSFCDDYSRQHKGWRVKVDAYDPSPEQLGGNAALPPRFNAMAANLIFRGIGFEDGGAQFGLSISLASEGELFTHRLMHPTFIVALASNAGLHEGLLIHEKNGGLLQIRFREPARPELLDGWKGAETRNPNSALRLPDRTL